MVVMIMSKVKSKKRSSLEKYKLKRYIEILEKKRCFNQATCLVSLYIPPRTQLGEISALLRNEYGTAANIKDKNTGKAVQGAISSILSRLKNLSVGPNGLVIFCGMTRQNKIEFYAIDPPEPITIKRYVCDTVFHVEHLKEQLEDKKTFGLISIDRQSATFAIVRGTRVEVLVEKKSNVPRKQDAGGQSQRRFERNVEIAATAFLREMVDLMNKLFVEEHPVEGILVGGPSQTKNDFVDQPNLDHRLRNKIIALVDTGDTGELGIRELLQRGAKYLEEVRIVEEKKLVQRFLEKLAKESSKVVYGLSRVREAIEASAVDLLLISEGVDQYRITLQCENCGHTFVKNVPVKEYDEFSATLDEMKCEKCGGRIQEKEVVDLVDELGELAEQFGTRVEIISLDHEEGEMLYRTFGGFAGILRFKYF